MSDQTAFGTEFPGLHGGGCECDLSRRRLLAGLGAAGAVLGLGAAGAGPVRAASAAKPSVIDVHRHIMAPKLQSLYAAQGKHVPNYDNDTVEKMLADMDAGGVARSIITLTSMPATFRTSREDDIAIARDANEYMARRRADHPGRFGFFAQLPMPHVDATLAEIAYALDTLKADGVQFLTSYGNKWMGEPEFAPVYEELNRRKTPVYTHPLEAACCIANVIDVPSQTVEYGADTARTISRWLLSGSAARYPAIRPIFSHAGGVLVGMIERLALLADLPAYKDKLPNGLDHELQRFYYDTAQAYHKATMRGLRTAVPVSQIVFGSDYPYRTALETVVGLRDGGVFNAAELRAIGSGNVRSLLGLRG